MTETDQTPDAQLGGQNASPRNLTELIDRINHAAQRDSVSLRDVVEELGTATFAPVLLVPALAVVTPLSGIPLFSATMGTLIFLVSMQLLWGRSHLWLPRWLLDRSVEGAKMSRAFQKVRPAARWVDRHTAERLQLLVTQPLILVPRVLCALSGLVMPVLEFIPFSSSILGLGVVLMAFGMMTRDGIYIVAGVLPYAVVAAIVTAAIP